MLNDAFDDVGTAPQLAGAFLEVFSARTRTIEHFGRRNIVNRSANRAIGVNVHISKGGILLACLMVGQWIIHNRVARDFGNRDVLRDVVQVGSVVLPHEKKLTAVAENGGTNAALFEAGVLLNDAYIPAIEFAKLRVTLFDNFLTSGNVEKTCNFFIDVSFPRRSRQEELRPARLHACARRN